MRLRRFLTFAVLVLALAAAGCGGSGSVSGGGNPPPANSAPVSITLTDTPPAGVTVLSFEVTITRAVLQPGNVPLVTSPLEIEVKQLEVESALLNTINVPAGSYTGIDITFTNPELTFKNDTGATLAGCANGAICEIQSNVTATASYSGAPFPLTLTANTPVGLLVDVNLNSIIDNTMAINLSAASGITVTQLPAGVGVQMEEMEDVTGRITAKDAANNQFTMQVRSGQSLTVTVDNNTVFEDFDKIGCAVNNFTCVAVGQVLEVDLRLISGGMLLARKVEVEDEDAQNQEEFEGLITSVNSATQFDMVLLDELPDVAAIDVGQRVRVNLLPGTQFRVDNENLSVGTLSFASSLDLMVGQHVEIKRRTAPTGTPPAVDTDRVKLKKGAFTGKVKAKLNATDFTVDNLPSLFTNATPTAITEIEVRTSTQTQFKNVTGVAALNIPPNADTVSISGLLFKGSGGSPVMVARKVRKR